MFAQFQKQQTGFDVNSISYIVIVVKYPTFHKYRFIQVPFRFGVEQLRVATLYFLDKAGGLN